MEQRKCLRQNMRYFSEITQKTLSAFHKAGIDASLLDEITHLKLSLRSKIELKLIDVKPVDDKYKRIFSNGHTDIVNFLNIMDPVFIDNNSNDFIKSIIKNEVSPITKMGMSTKIAIINTDRKPINRLSEQLFFM